MAQRVKFEYFVHSPASAGGWEVIIDDCNTCVKDAKPFPTVDLNKCDCIQ